MAAATSSQAAPKSRLESLTVQPISLISGEVELPGSKSLSNRVLLLSALAEVKHTRHPSRQLLPYLVYVYSYSSIYCSGLS